MERDIIIDKVTDKQETSCLASRTSDHKKRKPELQIMFLKWYWSPFFLALAAFWKANQKSGDIYLTSCPHSQQDAKVPNKEETVVPPLYTIINFFKWVNEEWCLTPSSADKQHTTFYVRQRISIFPTTFDM